MATYTILMHQAANTRFAVYKTTGDPNDQGTWAAIAGSEIDFTNEVYSLWAVKDGTHIHIVTQEASTRRVAYHDFNTGTDTWTTENEEIDAVTGAQDDHIGCSIAIRSDGDKIVIYSDDTSPGVQWARWEGSSWTLGDLGGGVTVAGVIVKGSSDRMHCFYHQTVADEVLSRTIRSDNTISTEIQAHANVSIFHGVGQGISYDDEGTQRVRVPVRGGASADIEVIEFDSADSPTFADTGSVTIATKVVNSTVLVGLSVDQKNLQMFFVNATASSVSYQQNDDDAGWSAGIIFDNESPSNVDGLSVNVIARVGLVVFALIQNDTNFGVQYRELILRVVTASTFANAHLPIQNYYVGPFKDGSNYYTVLMHEASNKVFTVYTATSPLSSWSAVANSSIISANRIMSLWVDQQSTDLHVVTQTVEFRSTIRYHKFSTSSDTWTVENEDVDSIFFAVDAAEVACSIGVRTDGIPVTCYTTATAIDPGTLVSVRTGGTWSVTLSLDTASYPGIVVKGDSNRMHIIYQEIGSPNDIIERTVKSDDTLEAVTIVHANPDTDIKRPFGHGISYDDGGTQRVRIPIRESSSDKVTVAKADSADAPTWSLDVDAGDHLAKVLNDQLLAGLSVQTKELQLLYVRDSDDDIYLSTNNDDAGWRVNTQEIVSTVIGMSQNSIGSVISVIYQISGGALTYAEINQPVMPAFADAKLPQQNYYVGPFEKP